MPESVKGISKISVQTGTTHGGVVLPDGSIARVSIAFDTLKDLSKLAREEFGLGGAVQHGASTLPDEAFDMFVGLSKCLNVVKLTFPPVLREDKQAWM
jgi:fructose/tagatose bisphosphate aldolase